MTRSGRPVAAGVLAVALAACGDGTPAGGGADGGGDGGAAFDGGGARDDGGPAGLTFGFPVYTQAEIDGWSTASPEYGRLAGTWAGNVGRAHSAWGEEIDSDERDVWKDESVYLKVQAVLWAADGTPARQAKVAAMLDELGAVTAFEWDAGEQYRLVAGWACTNVAQAAALTGYADPALTRFLVETCDPILDWTGGGNWHASFADSKLAIAAYVGDETLWRAAVDYFDRRIAQSIYLAAYDGDRIVPLRDDDGDPHVGLTLQHWGGTWGPSQVNADFTPVDPAAFPDGTNCERTRDLGHVSMGLGAWMHGARTIRAQGEALAPHAHDRLRAAYGYHGERVLAYLETGEIPDPGTYRGDGGGALRQSWFGGRRLFGDDTPAVVDTLCARDEVIDYPPAGANHLVAEPFADGE